tara:strand:- start:1630 stop:2970 length:1341 start_codon:yes stop_codon:yes gene_type:complete
MASLTQRPDRRILPAYSNITFSAQANMLTLFAAHYYRFLWKLKIYKNYHDGSGGYTDEIHEVNFKVAPNTADRGIVDVANVIKDYVATDTRDYASNISIHNIPKYSRNIGNLVKVEIYLGAEYSETAMSTVLSEGPFIEKEYLVFNGCQQVEDGLEFNYEPYTLNKTSDSNTGYFLSGFDKSVNRKLRRTDYATIGFFNGSFQDYDANNNTSKAYNALIKFYNSADVQQGATITVDNETVNGGATPSAAPNGDYYGLLYFGVGAKNLTDSGVAVPAATSYYTVYFTGNDGSITSQTYTYELQDADCKGYEVIRLAYLNRLGAYDYYNFTKLSRRTTNISRENYTKNLGTWQGEEYSYNTFDRARTVLSTSVKETIEANTDYITELEAEGLEELFTSPAVWMYDDSNQWQAVVVTEESYTKQTTANDMLKQYIIAIEKSHDKRIQTS